jgi:hypothetical protein
VEEEEELLGLKGWHVIYGRGGTSSAGRFRRDGKAGRRPGEILEGAGEEGDWERMGWGRERPGGGSDGGLGF